MQVNLLVFWKILHVISFLISVCQFIESAHISSLHLIKFSGRGKCSCGIVFGKGVKDGTPLNRPQICKRSERVRKRMWRFEVWEVKKQKINLALSLTVKRWKTVFFNSFTKKKFSLASFSHQKLATNHSFISKYYQY